MLTGLIGSFLHEKLVCEQTSVNENRCDQGCAFKRFSRGGRIFKNNERCGLFQLLKLYQRKIFNQTGIQNAAHKQLKKCR